jgi:hypothetical protein
MPSVPATRLLGSPQHLLTGGRAIFRQLFAISAHGSVWHDRFGFLTSRGTRPLHSAAALTCGDSTALTDVGVPELSSI